MGKTISIKVLFGIYLLLMAGKVFAFSCNVDGGSSIGAGTTSVYVNLDPVIQPGQNLVVDLSQHISCWNDYGGWYDTDHINLVQGSAFAGSLQSYKGSLYWNNVTYPFPLTTNTNVLDIGDKTPMPLPLKLYITPVGAAGGVVIKAGEVIARIHMYKIATLGSGNPRILDKDYAFSDGEILMVDNAVRTHFEPYERHFKEIGFNENTIKKYLQCTNIQTVTVPVPAKFLRASNVPTGLLNEMIAYLNSEERNHHNFSELLLFSCLSIFAACKGFITLLTNGVLSVSGKVRNIVNMKLAHPWKLKDICDCLYISESLLKKKLKQEQTTFSQILLDARMQHAKNLIRVEGSVNKIAEQCGYASTSYFIYTFRKHFGNSPKRVSKEYRCQSHTGMNTGNTMSALAI